jgi:hypothetical protein
MESQYFSMLFPTFYFHISDSVRATWHGEKYGAPKHDFHRKMQVAGVMKFANCNISS